MRTPDRLFIDTWGWLTLFDDDEKDHEQTARYYRRLREQNGSVFTTDYVLDETITLGFQRLPFDHALDRYQNLKRAQETGFLDLRWIGPDRFGRAMELRRKYDDKPDISFTDLTSMVVMQELELRDVLTGDAHFEHVGMGFRLQP
jgi:predicted nucleic acid-binding protein